MAKTWIVVADSSRARIFKPLKDQAALQCVKEILHPASQAHERDLVTDAPGRSFNSQGPGRHAMSESVSPKEHESQKLCKKLTDHIEKGRTTNRFTRLVLVAAPALLGQLRKSLSAPASRLIVKEIDKDLAHMDEREIAKHLHINN